jgi:hypothetical protein
VTGRVRRGPATPAPARARARQAEPPARPAARRQRRRRSWRGRRGGRPRVDPGAARAAPRRRRPPPDAGPSAPARGPAAGPRCAARAGAGEASASARGSGGPDPRHRLGGPQRARAWVAPRPRPRQEHAPSGPEAEPFRVQPARGTAGSESWRDAKWCDADCERDSGTRQAGGKVPSWEGWSASVGREPGGGRRRWAGGGAPARVGGHGPLDVVRAGGKSGGAVPLRSSPSCSRRGSCRPRPPSSPRKRPRGARRQPPAPRSPDRPRGSG